jgi:hypothetical protein
MGLEALTPVAVRRLLSTGRLDREGLATKWQVDVERLDVEVRKRVPMQGDTASYAKAKRASERWL